MKKIDSYKIETYSFDNVKELKEFYSNPLVTAYYNNKKMEKPELVIQEDENMYFWYPPHCQYVKITNKNIHNVKAELFVKE